MRLTIMYGNIIRGTDPFQVIGLIQHPEVMWHQVTLKDILMSHFFLCMDNTPCTIGVMQHGGDNVVRRWCGGP